MKRKNVKFRQCCGLLNENSECLPSQAGLIRHTLKNKPSLFGSDEFREQKGIRKIRQAWTDNTEHWKEMILDAIESYCEFLSIEFL